MQRNDGELGRAIRSAKYSKGTANFALLIGLVCVVIALLFGLNSAAFIIGGILFLAGIALRIGANIGLNSTIWRLAFDAIDLPVPPTSQVPVALQRQFALMFQMSVAEYAASGFIEPLDDIFARLVRQIAR